MIKTKHRVIRNILIDMICAGIALVVFALFHHVLPRQQQSLGIVIPNPNATAQPENSSSVMDWLISSASAESESSQSEAAAAGNGKNGLRRREDYKAGLRSAFPAGRC